MYVSIPPHLRRAARPRAEAALRFLTTSRYPGVIDVNPIAAAFGGLGNGAEPASIAITRLENQVNEVYSTLIRQADKAGVVSNAWQRLVNPSQTFKERIGDWKFSADAAVRQAKQYVAEGDKQKFDQTMGALAKILSNAQNYAREISDSSLVNLVGSFIYALPKSVGIVWDKSVEATTRRAGDLTAGITWAAAKPVLITVGVVGVGVYALGKALKSANVRINTPWATVGAEGARGPVSGYGDRRGRKRRSRRRRRRS